MHDDLRYMTEALEEARAATKRGDRAIGCVIVHDGRVVSRGGNESVSSGSEIRHAEIQAISRASDYLRLHGPDCCLYTTLEPCLMCLGAIAAVEIGEVVYGEEDPARGGTPAFELISFVTKSVKTYRGGVLGEECRRLRIEASSFKRSV